MTLPHYDDELNQENGPNRILVPFVACGDLSGFDSDGFYPLKGPDIPVGPLGTEYVFRDVVQPPTEPAYKKAVELKKKNQLVKPTSSIRSIVKSFEKINPYTKDENAGNIGYDDDLVESLADFLQINDS
ncbi:unnamed protein product [Cylicostephanus goldi]|uniref:Ribosomal RNA methyltransferase FtsJ domain-containing protein n=2 Tax=Strongylidae TaxID=27830 RepID=A0A3P6QRM0_CYLGO|nr:unnamed protein product [Cylicostephanus goldi]